MQDQPTAPSAEQPQKPIARTERPVAHPQTARRRSGCLRSAAVVIVTFLITTILIVGVASYLLARHPEWALDALRFVTPTYYPLATAAAEGETVHVLYQNGSLVPEMVQTGGRGDLRWRTEAFHGTVTDGAWTGPAPVEPFTSAVRFQETPWVLGNGGYRTWSDGAWSEIVPKTEWLNPKGCVAGGTLWVFYEDKERVLSLVTTTDGTRWEPGGFRQQLPSFLTDEENRFLEKRRARFRVAVLDDKPYVFWYDPARGKVRFRFFDQTWSQPQTVTATRLFAVVATDRVLYFFDVPAWQRDEEFGYGKATVTMRTFDGKRWSEDADELDVATTFCLDASRVGNDIWLFTSSYKSLQYTVYSDGEWGPTLKVPRPQRTRRVPAETSDQ